MHEHVGLEQRHIVVLVATASHCPAPLISFVFVLFIVGAKAAVAGTFGRTEEEAYILGSGREVGRFRSLPVDHTMRLRLLAIAGQKYIDESASLWQSYPISTLQMVWGLRNNSQFHVPCSAFFAFAASTLASYSNLAFALFPVLF